MPHLFVSYLTVKDIINLYFVSGECKKRILKKFKQIYFISTGFCSAKQWILIIQKVCYGLMEEIFNQNYFDEIFLIIILVTKRITLVC